MPSPEKVMAAVEPGADQDAVDRQEAALLAGVHVVKTLGGDVIQEPLRAKASEYWRAIDKLHGDHPSTTQKKPNPYFPSQEIAQRVASSALPPDLAQRYTSSRAYQELPNEATRKAAEAEAEQQRKVLAMLEGVRKDIPEKMRTVLGIVIGERFYAPDCPSGGPRCRSTNILSRVLGAVSDIANEKTGGSRGLDVAVELPYGSEPSWVDHLVVIVTVMHGYAVQVQYAPYAEAASTAIRDLAQRFGKIKGQEDGFTSCNQLVRQVDYGDTIVRTREAHASPSFSWVGGGMYAHYALYEPLTNCVKGSVRVVPLSVFEMMGQ